MAKKKIYRKINNVKLVKALRNENNQLKSKLQQRKEVRQKYLVGTYRAIDKAKNVKWVKAFILNKITDRDTKQAAKKWLDSKKPNEINEIYYEILRRFSRVNNDDDLHDLVITHYNMYILGSRRKQDYRYTIAAYMEAQNRVFKAINEKTLTKEQEEGLKEFLLDKIGEDSFYVEVDHNIQPALFIAMVNQLGI